MAKKRCDDIESRIAAAQEALFDAKHDYDRACAELKDLIAERDSLKEAEDCEDRRKEELWDALVKSDRSYEEVISWLRMQR